MNIHEQDTLLAEISDMAWTFAPPIVKCDFHEDVAQTVVLDCLVVLRAGEWNTPHEFLAGHVAERIKQVWRNMRRFERRLVIRRETGPSAPPREATTCRSRRAPGSN